MQTNPQKNAAFQWHENIKLHSQADGQTERHKVSQPQFLHETNLQKICQEKILIKESLSQLKMVSVTADKRFQMTIWICRGYSKEI